MKIPRVMSTQHPDNIYLPFFAENKDMSGSDELQEVYYVFSHLACDEQMWDYEGKEVDNFVLRKLFTEYEHFFKSTKLGEDVFLTLRVPNPDVEKGEPKVLLETLESIARQNDIAKIFYGDSVPSIFEVILPMTISAKSLNRVYYYYKDYVVGKQNKTFYPGDIKISEWVGKFEPETINVIPLFEDKLHQLEAHNITREYLKDKKVKYQRVFIARSDPAMNYGMVSAVLCNKIALQRLSALSEEIGVEIYPILGAGSPPFRGHLSPDNVERVLKEYPYVQTFTVQSSFKYDNPVSIVVEAIEKIKKFKRHTPEKVDEQRCLHIIEKISKAYREQVTYLAEIINFVATFVPRRRMRKLHTGLFGYSRHIDKIRLPRVISFCASCYSIGLPPEILGLSALSREDVDFLRTVYSGFDHSMSIAMSYFNEDVFNLLPDKLKDTLKIDLFDYKIDQNHKEITSRIISNIKLHKTEQIQKLLEEAAHIRKFLG